MANGKFITFEGGDGSGKSTQVDLLASYLEKSGLNPLVTREPGGCALGEEVRRLILERPPKSPDAEFLLFAAARSEHINTIVLPALKAGRWIVCDRYIDSTRVYQGLLGGVALALIRAIEDLTIASRAVPDLTIVVDVPPDVSFERAKTRGALSRFDAATPDQYRRIRDGFAEIADAEPQRCALVDGTGTVEAVHKEIVSVVNNRLLDPVDKAGA